MLSTIYEKQRERRIELIKKLFAQIAKDTYNKHPFISVKLEINEEGGGNLCGDRFTEEGEKYILIAIDLVVVKKRVRQGFSDSYYSDRPDFLNRYIINNKHNTIRFILYHEARHAYQRLNGIRNSMSKEKAERDADGWAIKHLEGVK